MKLSYAGVVLSLSLAGCSGMASAPTSPPANAGTSSGPGSSGSSSGTDSLGPASVTLSDTATESADLTVSLGQDGMTMGQSGFGGVSFNQSADHVEIVGSLLMAMISPKACASGTLTITMAPAKTSTCANIGTYPGGSTLTFAQCTLHNGASIDGSIVLDDTRDLAMGQACSATAVVDMTRAITIASLTYTSKDKSTLNYSSVNATTISEHALGSRPTMIMSKLSGERKVTDAKMALVVDDSFSSSVTVVMTAKTATTAASETINGMSTVMDHVANSSSEVDMKDVEKVRDCCKPISGTITKINTPSGGTATTDTVTFGPKCGDITVDGKAITLHECL